MPQSKQLFMKPRLRDTFLSESSIRRSVTNCPASSISYTNQPLSKSNKYELSSTDTKTNVIDVSTCFNYVEKI